MFGLQQREQCTHISCAMLFLQQEYDFEDFGNFFQVKGKCVCTAVNGTVYVHSVYAIALTGVSL